MNSNSLTGNQRSGLTGMISIGIAALALIVSLYQAYNNHRSATTAIANLELALMKQQQDTVRIDSLAIQANLELWQRAIVYDIIDSSEKGVSFEALLSKYREAGISEPGVDLKKNDLQPNALKKILLSLLESQVIFRTFDGNYWPQRSVVTPDAHRAFKPNEAKRFVLSFLARESGIHSMDELRLRVTSEIGVTVDEISEVMTELLVSGAIAIDDGGKVTTILKGRSNKSSTK